MLRFGAEQSAQRQRRVPAGPRVWPLVVRLAMTAAVMLILAVLAKRLATQETGGEEKGESAVPPVATPAPHATRSLEPVEPSRLSGYEDYSGTIAAEPYFYLLDLARRNPPELLEQAARRDVTLAHLHSDPGRYRGQLVLLKGRLRRLLKDDFETNDYGLTTRYEGCLYTDEGGRTPYIVIVTEPPAAMPLGMIYEHVSVAGYFLGWWYHDTQEGKRYPSPVFLARRLLWHTAPLERPEAGWSSTYGLAVGIAVAVACLAVAWFSLRRKPIRTSASAEPAGPLLFEEKSTQDWRVVPREASEE
jgi:hypothetical protein